LSITPPLIKNNIEPGQVWKSSIKLVNNNAEELRAYVAVRDFVSGKEDGTAVFIDSAGPENGDLLLSSWIAINQGPYAVPPHSSEEIPFIIEVPADASPGGHYAAILTGTKPPEVDTHGSSVKISAMLATLLLMSVSGEIDEAGSIREFSTDRKYYTDSNVKFTVRFENQGNIHLQPQGEIKIFDMFDKEIDKITINHQTEFGNVLPQSTRKWEYEWRGGEGLLDTGRYKAELILTYGERGKETTEQVSYFWIIKYKPLLLILAGIIFFILLLILYIRRSVKRAIITTQEMAGRPVIRQNSQMQIGGQNQTVDLNAFLAKNSKNAAHNTGYSNWSFMKKFFLIILLILGVFLVVLGVAYYRGTSQAPGSVPEAADIVVPLAPALDNSAAESASTTMEQVGEIINNSEQALGTSTEEESPAKATESKKASVVVLNGSGRAGAANQAAERLEKSGYLVVNTGNADSFDYQYTRILFKKEFEKTAGEIRSLFAGEVELESAADQAEDIKIIIGQSGL